RASMDGVATPCDTAAMVGGDDTRSLDDETGARPPVPSTPGAEPAPPAVEPRHRLGPDPVRAPIRARRIGEGLAAHDPELDRLVALKIVKSGIGGGSPEARARFLREAQAMARLNHPNVVSVFDVSSVGERVFVAMELVEGPTLADWLADGPHPWRDV